MNKRLIVLDTETTGIDCRQHRLIEIAAIEMSERRLTDHVFHCYINPQREIDPAAQAIHGITQEFLRDKPLEEDVIDGFLEFVDGSHLIIHNAPFDVGFLNTTLLRHQRQPITAYCDSIIDTLTLARSLHPGKKNSLDALCERYHIDTSERKKHGALIDIKLLAQVYLCMTRGQENLEVQPAPIDPYHERDLLERQKMFIETSPEDEEQHAKYLEEMRKKNKACVWLDADQKTENNEPS